MRWKMQIKKGNEGKREEEEKTKEVSERRDRVQVGRRKTRRKKRELVEGREKRVIPRSQCPPNKGHRHSS